MSGVSGILANFDVCGADIRATGKALGENKYSGFDDSQSTVSHAKLPVFTRDQTNFAFNASDSVVNTTLVVPPNEPIRRKSLRRRNFHNVLDQKGWYGRDGHNMPTFYNNTSSVLDFLPLGFIPSSMSFADGSPQNISGVYAKDCAAGDSTRSYFDLNVSNASLARNFGSLDFSACDPFVKRGILPEEVYTLFKFNELKKQAIASEIVKLNKTYTDASSSWFNFEGSYANLIEDVGFDKYLSPTLDKKGILRGYEKFSQGLQYVYNTYNNHFLSSTDGSSLPENHLNTLKTGGPTILSHTYGPLYFNADFSVDGSSINSEARLPDDLPGTDLISTTVETPYNIQLNVSGSDLLDVGVSAIEASNTPYYGLPEFVASHFLSGISFIDTSSVDRTNLSSIANTFAIYDLINKEKVKDPRYDNHLIQNRAIFMESKGYGLPRIKYDLSGHTEMENNILLPEHEFELSVDFATGQTNTANLGGGTIGILLRTKVETINGGGKVVFFWTPDQQWKMEKVSDLTNSSSGIDTAIRNAHFFSGNEPKQVENDDHCGNTLDNTSVLRYITKDDIVSAKIDFHTNNNETILPVEYATYYNAGLSSIYTGRRNQLHRANLGFQASSQDYVIEIFQKPTTNPQRDFVLVDKINVIDKNLKAAAEIPYEAQIPDLNTQSTSGDKEQLLLPDGSVLGPTFKVMDGAEIITTTFEQTDLLRNQPGVDSPVWADSLEPAYGYNQALWSRDSGTGPYDDPSKSAYINGNVANGIFLINKFVQSNPETVNQGGPWGRVPFTGICNRTITSHHRGVSEIDQSVLPFSEYSILWKNYWYGKHGFLSFNDWSPYVNDGPRTMVGDGYKQNQFIGQGLGLAKWTRGSTITANNNNSDHHLQGLPLQALARPGQSYDEQWLPEEYSLGSLETNIFSTNGSMNPLQERRADDEFDYADIDDPGWIGDLGGNPINRKTSVGSPIMMDFTTRRVQPNFDETSVQGAGPLNILNSQLGLYQDGGAWEYTPDSYYLSSTIMDPLGQVPSGLAMYSLWDVDLSPGDNIHSDNEPDNFNIGANFDDLVVDSFWDKGHGITFPPNAVYRDIPRNRLVDTELYSFNVYVRGQDQKHTAFTQNLHPFQDHWATSAIVTLAPIGSTNTYTRVVVKLGDIINDGTVGYSEADARSAPYTSSILIGGHSLNGGAQASVEEIAVPRSGQPVFAPIAGTVSWYRIRVTIPYDAAELDSGGKENLGIRCTVQAINDRFDGSFPDNLPQDGANKDTVTYVPCKLMTWGHALYQGSSLGTFRRTTGTLKRMGAYSSQNFSQYPNGQISDAIWYDSGLQNTFTDYENIEVGIDGRQIHKDDDSRLHYYNRSLSSLQPLTYTKGEGITGAYNTKVYNKVTLLDNSGLVYSGPITYGINKKLMRPGNTWTGWNGQTYGEGETARTLQVSGASEGTNVGKKVKGSVPIEPVDLLHIFRYFNTVGKAATGKGFNTRVAADSAAIHDASGGSRLSYRVLPDLSATVDGTFKNFTGIFLGWRR